MGDMRDVFEGYKDLHKQRVAENPQRLEYAKKLLSENGITFKVCNEQTGQINCYFANGTIYTFYAGTGKIQGYKNLRGIHNFVRLCKGQKVDDKIHLKEIKANESSKT